MEVGSRAVRLAVAFGAALLLAEPAWSQGAKVSSPIELARAAERLKPGEWVWAPSISPRGPVTVYVDLSAQLATVYRNGVRIGVSTVSTGKPGHETPTGVFTILQKDAKHRSSKYNNAPMPYTQRLTWDGIALHAGGLPGYPESHGCIHLPMNFARQLFEVEHLGGTVVIAGSAADHAHQTRFGVLQPGKLSLPPLAPGQAFRWEPHRSPSGPVTVVVSRADQQAMVMRDGVEIGRAPVRVPTEQKDTHVLTLAHSSAGDQWVTVRVPGHEESAEESNADLPPVDMPPEFYAQLRKALSTGATVLVTSAPLKSGATGRELVVMSATR